MQCDKGIPGRDSAAIEEYAQAAHFAIKVSVEDHRQMALDTLDSLKKPWERCFGTCPEQFPQHQRPGAVLLLKWFEARLGSRLGAF
jgi:hypothetical protein